MTSQWRKPLVKILFWLMTEAVLNLSGLDVLSNYGEFVFAQKSIDIAPVNHIAMIL
jgi:hypothetical protein